jgi:hypothetical protein
MASFKIKITDKSNLKKFLVHSSQNFNQIIQTGKLKYFLKTLSISIKFRLNFKSKKRNRRNCKQDCKFGRWYFKNFSF